MKHAMVVVVGLMWAAVPVGAEGLPGIKEIACPPFATQAGRSTENWSEGDLGWTQNGEKFFVAQCHYENAGQMMAFWSENYSLREEACGWEWFKREIQPGTYSIRDVLKPSYFGLGFQYSVEDDHLIVKMIFRNSPAEQGGLMLGDHIMAISGQATKGMSLDGAAKLFAEAVPGSPVQLIVRRPDVGRYVVLELTRAEIRSDEVQFQVYSPTHFVYVSVRYPNTAGREAEDRERWHQAAVEYLKTVEQTAVSCLKPAEASPKGPAAE